MHYKLLIVFVSDVDKINTTILMKQGYIGLKRIGDLVGNILAMDVININGAHDIVTDYCKISG